MLILFCVTFPTVQNIALT